MRDPRSQYAVARALGVSRTWLQLIERRALAKLAAACGVPPPPLSPWMRRLKGPAGKRHCSLCGQAGHYAPTCSTRWPVE